MTLQQRFTFYRERNAAPLAYYFARRKHATGYTVPDWLAYYVELISEARANARMGV